MIDVTSHFNKILPLNKISHSYNKEKHSDERNDREW